MNAALKTDSLRNRNKHQLRQRIVESAINLATEHGIDSITANMISEKAAVGRATFFRYFDSKEEAVIAGFYEQRLTALVDTLGAAPAALGPMEAVTWTFQKLGIQADRQIKLLRLHARMVSTSTALRAKAMEFHSRYETAIAAAVAHRYPQSEHDDLRPRLLATAVLAVTQACIEHWAQRRESLDLAALVNRALKQLAIGFTETV